MIKMKLGTKNCPDCGNLYSFIRGSTRGVLCRIDRCEAGFVTSNLPDFVTDVTEYTCYVEGMSEDWMRAVAWLGNRFNIPITRAREFRNNSSLPLIVRKASELFYLRSEFEEHGIQIRIEPEFRYSIDDIKPDCERPLNDNELQEMRQLINIELNQKRPTTLSDYKNTRRGAE